ncbi:MAG: penicillin-binding transpeptidase domain-containing protein [Actinomycetota bacterium]
MTDEETVYADWSALRVAVPVLGGLLIVVLVAVFGIRAVTGDDDPPPAGEQADAASVPTSLVPSTPEEAIAVVIDGFVPRLEEGRFAGLQFAFSDAAEADRDWATVTEALGPFVIEVTPGTTVIEDSANASVPLAVAWTLDDGVRFDTEGEVDLVLIGTDWLVDWEPAILETSLDPGDVLVRERVVAPRAPILGRGDVALVDNRPVIEVGVIPRQAGDISQLSAQLGALLGLDPGDIEATIAPRPSDSIVSIATRRVEQLQSVRGQLQAIPGVVLVETTFPLTPNERFGRALLGRSAEVTAEIIEADPEIFIAGDVAGRSGLQRIYNVRLAGQPGFQIRVDRQFPTGSAARQGSTVTVPSTSSTTAASGAGTDGQDDAEAPSADPVQTDPDVVFLSPPVEGTPLRLTIDQRVQNAAEDALAAIDLPSALVAVEPSTGHILAVANGPGAAVNNFAMTGRYPPGSTFKIVTAYGAMATGVQPSDPFDCPQFLNVNGRDFTNASGEVLGTVPLRRNFVLSCNTAFINIASVLEPSDFPAVAAQFGIGAGFSLGTDSFSGNVPIPGGPVEKAATSFGQARVEVSPLAAAVMAATAASGTYRPPQLILEPDATVPEGQPLDPVVVRNLQDMMRAVVTNGTGNAVAGVPGGPVFGKTGTAEFGDEVPPRAHAWFVGYQNDIAFAVFVEGGEFGGATAAPIAGRFLTQLAGG